MQGDLKLLAYTKQPGRFVSLLPVTDKACIKGCHLLSLVMFCTVRDSSYPLIATIYILLLRVLNITKKKQIITLLFKDTPSGVYCFSG